MDVFTRIIYQEILVDSFIFCQLKKGLKVLSNDRNYSKSAVTKPNLKIAGLQLSAYFGVSFSNFQIAKFSN
jgi:hypothetical protein